MGCSVVWQKTRSRTKDARILMLGLDDSGKTTILHKLKLPKENIPCTIPTMGFNVESVTPVKNMSFTLWDVGGGKKMKPLHAYYFSVSFTDFII